MSLARCFLLLGTVLFHGFVRSQTVITGFVRDSSGQPVLLASVVAGHCREERVLAYTTTGETGAFTLSVPPHDCDSILLTVRALGYRPNTHVWAVSDNKPADLRLNEAVLQEVVVRAQAPPVVVRQDTIEFNAASFADSTEFSVEDLLKKLPGVNVSEGGLITYNGKIVERVLIEGDDLFSQNYPLATRNIRADMIGKIQAIDHYQDNPMLKGIQESERMAFNLKIKDNKKRALSGSLTGGLGGGGDWRGKTHANLFSLARRDKTYFIANANNTGDNALGAVRMLAMGDALDRNRQVLQDNPLRADNLTGTPPFQNLGLPDAFVRRTTSGIISTGKVLAVSDAAKIKIVGWAGTEKSRQNLTDQSLFLFDGDTLALQKIQEHEQRNSAFNLQSELEYYAPNRRHSLRSFLKMTGQPLSDHLLLTRTATPGETQNVLQDAAGRIVAAHGTLEYSFKRNDRTLLQFIAKTAFYRKSQDLQANYPYYPLFFGVDTAFTQLMQQVRTGQTKTYLTGRCLSAWAGLQWQIESGIEWDRRSVHSDPALHTRQDSVWAPGDVFRNRLDLYSPAGFVRIVATKKTDRWLLQLWHRQAYHTVRLHDPLFPEQFRKLWPAEPGLSFRYNFNLKTQAGIRYDYRPDLPGLAEYYPAYLFSDYQTLSRALPQITLKPRQKILLFCRYNDPVKFFNWFVQLFANRNDNEPGTQYVINPSFFIQESYRPVQESNFSASASVQHFFSPISSSFEISLHADHMRSGGRINSMQDREFDIRQYSFGFQYGSAFDGWVNARLNAQWTLSVAGNRLTDVFSETRTNFWFSTLQFVVKPSSRLDFRFYLYQVGNQLAGSAVSFRHALRGECRWRLPAWRSEVWLSGLNLIGSRRFEQSVAGAFVQSNAVLEAVQPFFLIQWEYHF